MISIDMRAAGTAVTPYWKEMICADRAALSLRADVREHVAMAARECGFKRLRQHGIFHDDMFIWPVQEKDFNFQYLFNNYDFYLDTGVKPFVELSFLPRWMAGDDKTVFTCKCPACPPKDFQAWRKLVSATVKALLGRYGADEVRSWHFEVWNEPNIPFFSGTQAQYFELYRHAVDAVKSADSRLRVGGPATANFAPRDDGSYYPSWIDDFFSFCAKEKLPVDFVSTHPYPTNFPFDDQTGKWKRVVRDRDATFNDLTLLRRIVNRSPFPNIEVHCNEWGSSPGNPDRTHDHVFSATFHLENILRSHGLVDSLARWCLSDICEESLPGSEEFHGGWGIISAHGLKKPDFHAFSFLNRCGGSILYNDWKEGAAVFRSDGDTWQVLLYNHRHYANLEASWETAQGIEAMIGTGSPREFSLQLTGLPPAVRVKRSLLDREHAWAEGAWRKMGAPAWPKGGQLAELRKCQEPCRSSRILHTNGGALPLHETVTDLGVLFMELEKA